MNPDPKESLPREILEELMEEGAEAFRSVLEKLLNLAMELERGEWLCHPLDDSRQQATGSPIRWPLGHRRSSIVGLIRLRTRILSS